jgi:uncharacterized membrane protein YcaP (DUF421 family)
MDPLRILTRVVFAYIVLLVLMRLSGKRAVRQSNAFDFTLALILGDLIDDVVWAEVAVAQFVAATSVLVIAHTAVDLLKYRAGAVR